MIIPSKGDKVKIILSCGLVEEGIVEEWAEDDARGISWTIIKHPKSENRMSLQNYWIAGYSVIAETKQEFGQADTEPSPPPSPIHGEPKSVVLDDTIYEDLSSIPNEIDRVKRLAEIRKTQATTAKKAIAQHLSREDVAKVHEVKYVMPSFKKHSQE